MVLSTGLELAFQLKNGTRWERMLHILKLLHRISFLLRRINLNRSNWAPLLDVLSDSAIPPAQRAGIFHETMAQALVDQALSIRGEYDYAAVGLSGGVFQNRLLTELVVGKLENQGIEARLHQGIPANDGGLCFGQIIEAMARSQAQQK